MLFGQDPFQNLADVQSNSQCLSKGRGVVPGPQTCITGGPALRPGRGLSSGDLVQCSQIHHLRLNWVTPRCSCCCRLSRLPPCQHGCSQALCHVSVAQYDAPGAAPEASLPRLSARKDGRTVAEEAARLGDKKAALLATLHSAPAGLRLVPMVSPTAGKGTTLLTGGRALCWETPPVRFCQNQQICTLWFTCGREVFLCWGNFESFCHECEWKLFNYTAGFLSRKKFIFSPSYENLISKFPYLHMCSSQMHNASSFKLSVEIVKASWKEDQPFVGEGKLRHREETTCLHCNVRSVSRQSGTTPPPHHQLLSPRSCCLCPRPVF